MTAPRLAVGDRVRHVTRRETGITGIVQSWDARGKARVRWHDPASAYGWSSWVLFGYLKVIEPAVRVPPPTPAEVARAIANLSDLLEWPNSRGWTAADRDDLETVLDAIERTP